MFLITCILSGLSRSQIYHMLHQSLSIFNYALLDAPTEETKMFCEISILLMPTAVTVLGTA